MLSPQFNPPIHRELVIDLFAGSGGAPLKFQWLTESQSTGQCASAGCVRWHQ